MLLHVLRFSSPADIAIIIIAALIVCGPNKKPSQLLTELGQAIRELRRITRNK